jgi:hypothetical protein
VGSPKNGWRNGYDPVQRHLRIAAAVVFLSVIAWLVVIRETNDYPTLALLLGALFLLLGYETIVSLPFTSRRNGSKEDDEL